MSKRKVPSETFGFTPGELRILRSLSTPVKIQQFLDKLPYHINAATVWSPRRVLRERTAHCCEGSIFAAAALRANGYPPLVFDLEAYRDTDHVIAIFQERGRWGAIAASNYMGCRYREPVYTSLRELAMSYFEDYFNMAGERTLRTYSRPVNLARFDSINWMTTEEEIWDIPNYLVDIPHIRLLTPEMEKKLTRLDRWSFHARLTGHRWK
ncbi:MAG TPA: hypothetical protein VGQ71_08680 [Terriglobales bacterium]|jgi:hypothetical protein|nr:hypothetical protein [Terriglobales bacterium]